MTTTPAPATDLVIVGRRLHIDARTVIDGAIGVRDGRVAWLHAEPDLDPGARWPGVPCLHAGSAAVLPGLVDAHVHLRDPGQTHKEDIASGTRAAAAGGFTTIVAQPNTIPETADRASLDIVHDRIGGAAIVDVGVSARLPWLDAGAARELAAAGVCFFDLTFAGVPPHELPRALELARDLDVPLGIYAEDPDVVRHLTSVHADLVGARRDARVITAQAEVVACQRILTWLIDVRARVLFRQISTRSALEVLIAARRSGRYADFGIEVTPHHVHLDETTVEAVGERARIWPPLRPRDDVIFAWEALRDGHVDIVGSDHSPHAAAEKDRATDDPAGPPPPGFPGLETALGALLSGPVEGGAGLSIGRIIETYAEAPAAWCGLGRRKGGLHVGADADLILVDTDATVVVAAAAQQTRSHTTPFHGRGLRGQVLATLVRGRVVYRDGEVVADPGYGTVLRAERAPRRAGASS